MACYLSSVPNEWDCHDPQCNGSTWDHDCPTGPCTIPAHQANFAGPASRLNPATADAIDALADAALVEQAERDGVMSNIVIPNEAVDAFLRGDSGTNVMERTENGLRAAAAAVLKANRAQLDAAAERRCAVKALHHLGRICGHGVDYADVHGNEDLAEAVARVHVTVTRLAARYESGEVA